jgi:spore coat polysaccharide biosynthesis protein SpsF
MVLGILQARLSSSRLPGKVLKEIMGYPMLSLQIERLRRVTSLDKLIVATSTDPSDDILAEFCDGIEVECFRGDLNNVLSRFYEAASLYKGDIIVRLTGDCPLTDPALIDHGIEYFKENKFDYLSNTLERTFPIGLDFSIFTYAALRTAYNEAELPSEKEHVTSFIYNHPVMFKIGKIRDDKNLSHLRWTVDEAADFEFVRQVYEELYPNKPDFTTDDILQLLERKPELCRINAGIDHSAGYNKSLKEDARYRENCLKK